MAGNSKDSKILAYKDMINQLNKTISTQTELIQSLQKTLEADRLEKENLRQQIEYLTKKLFGTSSEKRKDIDGQLNLFDEAEQEADPTWEQELPDDITVPEHKRKARRTHADFFKNVPSCDEIISLPEEERNCPTCGTQMECIGKEFVRHEFRFTPAKGKVVNIYRETYKCPECAISDICQSPCSGTIDPGKLCIGIRCRMGNAPEVPEWSAVKQAGRGLEATGCPIKPGYAC